MNNSKTYTSTKIKHSINTAQYLIPIGLLLFSASMFFSLIEANNVIASVILLLSLIFFADLLWKLKSYQKIIVTNDYLFINTYCFKKLSQSKYVVDKIKNVKAVKKDKAETYSTMSSSHIMGINVTSEKNKKYDINPEALYFKYGQRTIKIGEGKQAFNAKQIAFNIKRQIKSKV